MLVNKGFMAAEGLVYIPTVSDSHAGNRGSIPLGSTNKIKHLREFVSAFFMPGHQ